MLIRYGYEITLNCAQPTVLVCLLSVHQERMADMRVPETFFTIPEVLTTTYLDLFGNRCRRLVAPVGDLTLWGDATIEDDGKIEVMDWTRASLPWLICQMNVSSTSWAAATARLIG